jgi:regulator of RNase E activity RraB
VGDIRQHLSTNVEQYCQRMKMRDDVDAPREVEHVALFRRMRDAAEAARDLESHGYHAEVTRRKLTRATLTATKTAAVDVDTADAMTEEVYTIVSDHDGDYDGWGAPVLARG